MRRLSALLIGVLLIVLVPTLRGEDLPFPPPEPNADPPPFVVSDSLDVTQVPEVAPIAPPAPDALFFFQQGKAAFDRNDYDLAIADFDEAVRLDPRNPLVYYTRGLAYYQRANDTQPVESGSEKKDDYDRALADMFDAILRDPVPTGPYLVRARVFAGLHRFDRARDDYNMVLRNDPRNQQALTERTGLKTLELAYAQDHSNTSASPAPLAAATPAPTPLSQALEQAALEEVNARLEKAKVATELYRRQRLSLPPLPPTTPDPTDATNLTNIAAAEALKAQIAASRAQQVKALADQVQAFKNVTDPAPAPPAADAAKQGGTGQTGVTTTTAGGVAVVVVPGGTVTTAPPTADATKTLTDALATATTAAKTLTDALAAATAAPANDAAKAKALDTLLTGAKTATGDLSKALTTATNALKK